MKKVILTVLIVGTLLVAGCGVPEEEYNQIVTDLQDLQSQYEDLGNEYKDSRIQHGELQTRYEDLQIQHGELQTQNEELQRQHAGLEVETQRLKDALDIDPKHATSRSEIYNNPDKYFSIKYKDNIGYWQLKVHDVMEKKVFWTLWDELDSYDKAIQLWCIFSHTDIKSIIVLCNLDNKDAPFEDCNDVLLKVLSPEGEYYTIDVKKEAIKYWGDLDSKPIPENEKYYDKRGFLYTNPSDFKADIGYRFSMSREQKTPR